MNSTKGRYHRHHVDVTNRAGIEHRQTEITVTDVEIINPILGKEGDLDKLSILDVSAKDASGRMYDIEMQTSLPAGLSQRLALHDAS